LKKCQNQERRVDGSRPTETTKYRPRGWVVRVPSAFVGYESLYPGGFQTVVIAETEDMAWEIAGNSDVWEQLDFPVEHLAVFPQNPL